MATIDLDLVPGLQRAVGEGALQIHYQPEVDLATGAVVGMEALLRWYHPQRGMLWPSQFLPTAEASGLMVPIGRWLLEQCVREARVWARLPSPPDVGVRQLWVNLSAAQLADPGLVADVHALVEKAELPGGTLGLEVSEETLAKLENNGASILRSLRSAGCALAIDDFGTWYSSLGSIGEVPVDAVKLDRKFVRGVGADLEDDSIVASVIRLAHARDLYVVAEGVESWAEGARLMELGCDRAHGYLFSGPQPADRARWMLSRGTGWRGRFLGDAEKWLGQAETAAAAPVRLRVEPSYEQPARRAEEA